MQRILASLLDLVLVIVTYFGLRWIGKRFFLGRYRAESAAAALVIAFLIGLNWPHNEPASPAASEAAAGSLTTPSAALSAAAKTSVGTAADLGRACASAHLTAVAGKGALDAISVQTRTVVEPAAFHFRLQDGDVLTAQGWAADRELRRPAVCACFVVDGKIVAGEKVRYGLSRPDVANAFHNDALSATGYAIELPVTFIGPGAHRVQVAVVLSDGSADLLTGGLQLIGPQPVRK